MRALVIVLVAIVLLAAAAIALAPASLMAPAVARATSNHVALADVEGTLWKGTATLAGDDGTRLPFAWTADPAALASREVHVHVTPQGAAMMPRGDIAWKDRSVRARDVSIALPAAWLARSVASTPAIAVTGDVELTIGSLDWMPPASAGEARVAWRNAHLQAVGAPPLELGDVTASLAANGDRLAGPIANDGGMIAIAGDLTAFADGAGTANVLLTPKTSDDTLVRALAAIGTPEGGGYRVRVQWPAR